MYYFQADMPGSYAAATQFKAWIDVLVELYPGYAAYLFGCEVNELYEPVPSELADCLGGGFSWADVRRLPEILTAANYHFDWLGLIVVESMTTGQVPADLRFVDGLAEVGESYPLLVQGAVVEVFVLESVSLVVRSEHDEVVDLLRRRALGPDRKGDRAALDYGAPEQRVHRDLGA